MSKPYTEKTCVRKLAELERLPSSIDRLTPLCALLKRQGVQKIMDSKCIRSTDDKQNWWSYLIQRFPEISIQQWIDEGFQLPQHKGLIFSVFEPFKSQPSSLFDDRRWWLLQT